MLNSTRHYSLIRDLIGERDQIDLTIKILEGLERTGLLGNPHRTNKLVSAAQRAQEKWQESENTCAVTAGR